MTAEALDQLRSRHRDYVWKARLLSLTHWSCTLAPLIITGINIWADFPRWHSLKWMWPVAWLSYLVAVLVFPSGIRARRYRKAADILAGAIVRLEVNPALPDEYWSGIEARVEQALRGASDARQGAVA